VVFDEVTYGIGAVVDVEQRTLRAFEQHALALLAQLVKDAGDVGLHRLDVFAEASASSSVFWKSTASTPRYLVSTKLW
jgi:hypothetical protein